MVFFLFFKFDEFSSISVKIYDVQGLYHVQHPYSNLFYIIQTKEYLW